MFVLSKHYELLQRILPSFTIHSYKRLTEIGTQPLPSPPSVPNSSPCLGFSLLLQAFPMRRPHLFSEPQPSEGAGVQPSGPQGAPGLLLAWVPSGRLLCLCLGRVRRAKGGRRAPLYCLCGACSAELGPAVKACW